MVGWEKVEKVKINEKSVDKKIELLLSSVRGNIFIVFKSFPTLKVPPSGEIFSR